MLAEVIQNWQGTIEVNGQIMPVSSILSKMRSNAFSDSDSIILHPTSASAIKSDSNASNAYVDADTTYRFTVKQYMTEKSYGTFDFMAKWNNDIPMPLRTMVGTIEKETKGMYYVHLHGEARKTITCAVCRKELTNPISRQYGIGPICLSKCGIVADISDVASIKEQLEKVEWSGWVIKSAITEQEILQEA